VSRRTGGAAGSTVRSIVTISASSGASVGGSVTAPLLASRSARA
jgi:hypothetical protein